MGQLSSFGSSKYHEFRNAGLSHAKAFQRVGALLNSKSMEIRPLCNRMQSLKPNNQCSMMIKTKSIQEKSDPSDGRRISVMRFPKGSYDEEYRDLAPSIDLLMDYKKNKIDWGEYERRYGEEMKAKESRIKELAERSRKKAITLLCFEKTDEKCHRRLLKDLIEKIGSKLTGGKN